MSCRVTNLTGEQIKNIMANRSIFFPKLINQTAEESVQRLEQIHNLKTLRDDIYFIAQNEIKYRVSERAKRLVGQSEPSISEDNTIKRETGTKIHDVLNKLVDFLYNKKGDINQIKREALSGEYPISSVGFAQLEKLSKSLISQIEATQKKIDPTKQAKILTELFVADPVENLGGTIDVLVVYSNNTADVYDYKTKSGIYGHNYTLNRDEILFTNDLFTSKDYATYNLTMSDYSRILLERYGIREVNRRRLVPIFIANDIKKTDQRKPGSILNKPITKILSGSDVSEHLRQVPIGGESTEFEGLNKLLNKQMSLKEKLLNKLKQGKLTIDERDQINQKIKRINTSIKSVIIDLDIKDMLYTVKNLLEDLGSRINEKPKLEDGSDNPSYISDNELRDYYDELNVYSNMVNESHVYFSELKQVNLAKYTELRNMMRAIAPALTFIMEDVRTERESRTIDLIPNIHKDSKGNIKPFEELNFFEKTFLKISEIKHPVFQAFWKLIQGVQYDMRQQLRQVEKTYHEKETELEKWAKGRGMTLLQAQGMIIDRETGNLFKKIKQEFWDRRNLAFQGKTEEDYKWLTSSYHIRDVDKWQERWNSRYDAKKRQLAAANNNLEDLVGADGKLITSSTTYIKQYERDLDFWVKQTNLLKSKDAWFNNFNYRGWVTIKPEVAKANHTDQYKQIEANKPLKDYYDMWTSYMSEFRELLGINEYSKLPDNFIPNIRKESIQHLTDNGFNLMGSISEKLASFTVREEDIHIGQYDESTGELRRNIPILFINKLKNKQGDVDNSLKSYDLGNSLMLFAKMAYNHSHMEAIEADVLNLKDMIGDPSAEQGGIEATDRMNRKIRGKAQKFLTILGIKTDTYKLFEDFSDYYLYGIKYKEKSLLRKLNTTKAILELKQLRSRTALSYAIIPAGGALLAGRTGLFIESKKSTSFTPEQLRKTEKLLLTNASKYVGISDLFHAYSEDLADKLAFRMSRGGIKKALSERVSYYPLRKVDEKLMDRVLISMAQNYGVTPDGNIIRLNKPGVDPKKYKSILDSAVFNEKTQEYEIKGLSKEGHISFRAAAKRTLSGVIGNMSAEEIAGFDTNLVMGLMMHFRTWMPGIVNERVRGLEYDEDIQALRLGRFNALFSEYGLNTDERDTGKKIAVFVKKALVPSIAKTILDITTFGLAPRMGLQRVNEARAKRHFEKFLIENPDLAEKVTFEEYLQAKEGQIKAALVELRIILGTLALITYLGGKDDGEKDPRYYNNIITRNLYKILTKSNSELSFMWNPVEFINLVQNPLPITSLLTLAMKTLNNTMDEIRDLLFGENSPQDRSPIMYYGIQWARGGVQLARFFELYENYKKSPY